MNRYNQYMNSHFSGCKLLAYAYDKCRKRDVKLFLIPGNMDIVGVSDGTDSWIAPVQADPFRVNIQRIFADIAAGRKLEPPQPPGPKRERTRILLDDPPPPPRIERKRIEEATPMRRRHAIID